MLSLTVALLALSVVAWITPDDDPGDAAESGGVLAIAGASLAGIAAPSLAFAADVAPALSEPQTVEIFGLLLAAVLAVGRLIRAIPWPRRRDRPGDVE